MNKITFINFVMCKGCPKSPGWVATGWTCPVYKEPARTIQARHGKRCPFNPVWEESKKAKKINPLKASKRGGR